MATRQVSLNCLTQLSASQNDFGLLDSFPEIVLQCNGFHHTATYAPMSDYEEIGHKVIIPVNESVVKRLFRTFWESGFHTWLNEARAPQTAEQYPLIAGLANFLHMALTHSKHGLSKILPIARDYDAHCVATYVETRNWERAYIRHIAWHPNCFKIAVAGSDDIIRIYTDEPAVMPVLKFGLQKWITSMAWRPYSPSELAVACQKGICLWTSLRSATPPSFFAHPNGTPVTSIQWNQDGTLLAAVSIGDLSVLLWNVDNLQQTPLHRLGPTCSLVSWSPPGNHLFTATTGNIFRIWTASNKWTHDRFTISEGHVQSSAWSPCGRFLLFVNSNESLLYCLSFADNFFDDNKAPFPIVDIADLTQCIIGKHQIGGKPQQIACDPSGSYLALTFKDSPCIVVFSTIMQRDVLISPHGFIVGQGTEFPNFICFKSKYRRQYDVVLTIGWSSGRVEYFPLKKRLNK